MIFQQESWKKPEMMNTFLSCYRFFDLTKDEYNKKLDAALENAKQTYEEHA